MSKADATPDTCWTPAWVRRITGGRWLGPAADPDATLNGLGIDTRTLNPGQVFLAVKGLNFDGHKFIDAAITAGAAMAILDREDAVATSQTPGLLLVDDTVQALHKLARAYRQRLRDAGCTVIAVAGSNGKTTTRHLIHTVLASSLKGTQSPKSFNNHLGVPLTMLGAALDDRFLVAEVGTNHPGEIDAMGALLQPDAAVITCIGHEHMEFFGDLHGVAEEEAAITRYLPDGGPLFIEKDAHAWVTKATSFNPSIRQHIYGHGDEATRAQRQTRGDRQCFTISESTSIDLPLLAPHDISNALAAVEVGRWMGLDDADIKASLEQARPMPGRLVVKRFGAVILIDDTYNANPDSVRAALEVLADYPAEAPARRVAVLGDMLELGDLAESAHRDVGTSLIQMARSGKLDQVALVCPLMAMASDVIRVNDTQLNATHYAMADDKTLDALADSIRPGDVVLCKGSRGLKLERLVTKIEQRFKDNG